MADLEKLYYSGESYRMAVIRSRITTILVNVYKMVRDLIAMGDGKYQELEPIFDKISAELEAIVERRPNTAQSGPLILPLAESRGEIAGTWWAKRWPTSGRLSHLPGISVPPGLSSPPPPPGIFSADHLDEINRGCRSLNRTILTASTVPVPAIRRLIVNAPLPADLEELPAGALFPSGKSLRIPTAGWPCAPAPLVKTAGGLLCRSVQYRADTDRIGTFCRLQGGDCRQIRGSSHRLPTAPRLSS
jgi:hypothetical protein